MKIGNRIQIQAINSDTVEVLLYGYIGKWLDIDSKNLVNKLKELEPKYKNAIFRVNSDGGDVIEGIAVFHALKSTSLNITFIIDGIAASMMAMLVQVPKAKRIIHQYAKFMFHRVSGGANGNADDMRSAAELMEDFENDFINILKGRGLDETTIKSKLLNGKDNWINAETALQWGLADEIITDARIIKEVANVSNANEACQFYHNQLINYNNQNPFQMEIKALIIAALARHTVLNANATDTQVQETVVAIVNENVQLKADKDKLDARVKELENKIGESDKAKVKALIDSAIEAKKITEDKRAEYTTLATADYATTAKIIEGMTGHTSVASQLSSSSATSNDTRKDWDWDKWARNDNDGLVAMREKDAARYEALYEGKFGKKPPKQ